MTTSTPQSSFSQGHEIVPGYRLAQCIVVGHESEVWQSTAPDGSPIALVIQNLPEEREEQDFAALDLIQRVQHKNITDLSNYWLLDHSGNPFPDELRQRDDRPAAHKLVIAGRLASRNLLDRFNECRSAGQAGIPLPELLTIMDQIAPAIDFLNAAQHPWQGHMAAILHCGIQPNRFVYYGDGLKLGNFGLAKIIPSGPAALIVPNEAHKSSYTAPEIFGQRFITRWTDQYSLAVTYAELRTGIHPIDTQLTADEAISAAGEGRLNLSAFSAEEKAILARATSISPDQRFGSCTDLVKELKKACANELAQIPIAPAPTPSAEVPAPAPPPEPAQPAPAPPSVRDTPMPPTRSGTMIADFAPQSESLPPSPEPPQVNDPPQSKPKQSRPAAYQGTMLPPGLDSAPSLPTPPQDQPPSKKTKSNTSTEPDIQTPAPTQSDMPPLHATPVPGQASHIDTDLGEISIRDTHSAIPMTQLGKYEVRAVLGEGAMGTVYRARDNVLGRDVALKVPKSDLMKNTELRQRFLREARSMAAIRHPNICTIHEFGELEGRYYLAMDLVEGPPLATLITALRKQTDQLEPEEEAEMVESQRFRDQVNDMIERDVTNAINAANIVAKVAYALQQVHDGGHIHRDIKPSNIMLENDGEPLLMDFGLARDTKDDSRLTQTQAVMGTPAYMSPEQVKGKQDEIDHRTDIYSLGTILYELLTGRLPFDCSGYEIYYHIRNTEPATPKTINPDIDEKLEAICMKAMAKNANERYQDAGDFADALQEYAVVDLPGGGSSTKKVVLTAVLTTALAAVVVGALFMSGILGTSSARENTLATAAKTLQASPASWAAVADDVLGVMSKEKEGSDLYNRGDQILRDAFSVPLGSASENKKKANGATDTASKSKGFKDAIESIKLVLKKDESFPRAVTLRDSILTEWLQEGADALKKTPQDSRDVADSIIGLLPENSDAASLKVRAQKRIELLAKLEAIDALIGQVNATPEGLDILKKAKTEFEDLRNDADAVSEVHTLLETHFDTLSLDALSAEDRLAFAEVALGFDLPQTGHGKVLLYRASAFSELKKFDEALEELNQAADLIDATSPRHRDLLILRGTVIGSSPNNNDTDVLKTNSELTSLLERNPEDEPVIESLAHLSTKLPNPQMAESVSTLVQAWMNLPGQKQDKVTTQLQRLVALNASHQYIEAGTPDLFEKLAEQFDAVKLIESDGLSHFIRAEAILRSQKGLKARNDADSYIAFGRPNAGKNAQYGLFVAGLHAAIDGNHAKAANEFREALRSPEEWANSGRKDLAANSLYIHAQDLTGEEQLEMLKQAVNISSKPPVKYRIELARALWKNSPADPVVAKDVYATTKSILAGSNPTQLRQDYYELAKLNLLTGIRDPSTTEASLETFEGILRWYDESSSRPDPVEFDRDILTPVIKLHEAGNLGGQDSTTSQAYAHRGQVILDHKTANWNYPEPMRVSADAFDKASNLYGKNDTRRAELIASQGLALIELGERSADVLNELSERAFKADDTKASHAAWGLKGYATFFSENDDLLTKYSASLECYSEAISRAEEAKSLQNLYLYLANKSVVLLLYANALVDNSVDQDSDRTLAIEKLKEAVEAANKAIEINDAYSTAHGAKGNALEDIAWDEIGRGGEEIFKQALAAFDEQIDKGLDLTINGHRNKGRCLVKMSQDLKDPTLLDPAISVLNSGLRIDNQDAEANYWVAVAKMAKNPEQTPYKELAVAIRNRKWQRKIKKTLGDDEAVWQKLFETALPAGKERTAADVPVLLERIRSQKINEDYTAQDRIADSEKAFELAEDRVAKAAAAHEALESIVFAIKAGDEEAYGKYGRYFSEYFSLVSPSSPLVSNNVLYERIVSCKNITPQGFARAQLSATEQKRFDQTFLDVLAAGITRDALRKMVYEQLKSAWYRK